MQNDYHDSSEDYEFLQEKIKDQDTKEQVRRGLPKIIGTGLLFGVCASISFFFMNPVLEKHFGTPPEEVILTEDVDEPETPTVEEPEEPEDTKPVEVDITLDMKSYKELQQVLVSTAREVSRSVVTITGIPSEEDETKTFVSDHSVSGVIVADNRRELLILGKTSVSSKAEEIDITFYDGKTYKSSHKKAYSPLGLSIYSIDKSEIQDKTLEMISVADLSVSSKVKKGETVICVGSPFGYSDSITYGTFTNIHNTVNRVDGEYNLISSDICGNPGSTGVFANLSGEIVGIADGSIGQEAGIDQLFGYETASIANVIESLSNGKAIPSTGINGYTVSLKMQESGIPAGVYVDSVVKDSPSMEAGLQSGDIVVSINHTSITSFAAYQKNLLDTEPGDMITLVAMRFGKSGYKQMTFKIETKK